MTEIIVKNTTLDSTFLQGLKSGDCFEAFVQSKKQKGLSDIGAYNLRSSTSDILNHCNPHDATSNHETTHLVVGYVQSGKTLSFTGVLAMARDNGYRIAIILTGITTNLQGQTGDRLEEDLNLSDNSSWFRFFSNPSKNTAEDIIRSLRLSEKPLLVIPILKHKKYIDNVTGIFRSEKVRSALGDETVLIIDDEADQASLNSFGRKNSKKTSPLQSDEESATYAAILRLRSQLPGNSYIQYTATPQANLLITTTDLLSPKSHTLLQPGEDYLGGKQFFGLDEGGRLYNGKLIIEIPEQEVYHKKNNPLKSIPSSLKEALMMHIWAVVLVIKWYRRPGIKQLSMMVHPTDIIKGNEIFEKWIKDILELWSTSLAKPTGHEDRETLLECFQGLFPKAIQFYPAEGRPQFEDIKDYIADVVNDCRVYRITGSSDDDPNNISWNSHRMNVLVGAQMLNRGFTVEKLATTYMPRHSLGITNADTIEQRCRFFGYKKDYIESCRVYLPKGSKEDYISYIQHEEELRTLLCKCSNLKEYEHRIMLSPRLRPTRPNVLPKSIVKSRLKGWVKFDHMNGIKMLKENKTVVGDFVSKYLDSSTEFKTNGYDSTLYHEGDMRKHSALLVSLEQISPLLTDYMPGRFSDAVTKSLILRYLQYLETMGNGSVKLVFMSGNQIRERRTNDYNDNSWHIQLFQGRSNDNQADNYCGDINIVDHDCVLIQIHHIKITGLPICDKLYGETYALTVNFPEKLQTEYFTSLKESEYE